MKVLVLTTTFPRWKDDSTPGFVYELSKRLKNRGLEIFILAPYHEGSKFYEEVEDLKIHRFPYFYPNKFQKLAYEGGILPNLKRSWLARMQVPLLILAELYWAQKLVKKEKIDLIHSHWLIPSGLVGGIISRFLGTLHITTAHAGDVFTMERIKILNPLGNFILKNSSIVTVNSKYTKGIVEILSRDIKNKPTIEIIPMGIDTKKFYPKGDKIDLFPRNNVIFNVGRLVEKKGVEFLIKAMPLILLEMPNAKLIIGGSGPDEKKLKNLVRSLKIEASVIFMGYIRNSDLPKYLRAADIFVLPSIKTKEGDTEGLGVVLLEAIACGVPVIGSNIGGITDIIQDGKNGLLAEPGNLKDIAGKVIKLLSDENLRQKFSEDGIKIVRERFSWNVVTSKFAKIYEDLK
jgi:glycosyltransferase involved in cell wall biosynthesis